MVYRKQLEVLNAKIEEQHQENENIQELLKESVSYTEFFCSCIEIQVSKYAISSKIILVKIIGISVLPDCHSYGIEFTCL